MKKVISVFLAVLMLFGTLGVVGVAEDTTPKDDVYCSDPECVSLVFNYMGFEIGTVYMGDLEEVTAGPNTGCYVLRGSKYFSEGNFIQLPEIKNTGDGTYGVWYLASITTAGAAMQGQTLSGGSYYQIPATAANGDYIVFIAQSKPIEQTSTFGKIATILVKIVKILLGDTLANKLVEMLVEMGVDVSI